MDRLRQRLRVVAKLRHEGGEDEAQPRMCCLLGWVLERCAYRGLQPTVGAGVFVGSFVPFGIDYSGHWGIHWGTRVLGGLCVEDICSNQYKRNT